MIQANMITEKELRKKVIGKNETIEKVKKQVTESG